MKISSKDGITSIETLMSVVLISLVSLIVISVLIFTQAAWAESLTHVKLYNQAKQPMQNMIKELKSADPESPIGVAISPEEQAITFAVPSSVSSSAVTSWQEISYTFDPVSQEIIREAGGSSIIGRFISDLNFKRSGNVIVISLLTEGTAANGRALSMQLISQASMRN